MALTCPNCGNDRNFLVKTLQMHVVQLHDSRVEANEEGRPAVMEILCDECENGHEFRGFRRGRPQRDAVDARRPLSAATLSFRIGLFEVVALGADPLADMAGRCVWYWPAMCSSISRSSRRIASPHMGHSFMGGF